MIRKIRNFFSYENINEDKFIESLANGKPPSIKSRRELELYVKYRVQDEEAAVVISEAFELTGNEGIVEIKRGRDGNPYKVECIATKLPSNMSLKQIKDRNEQYHVIIWINSFLLKEEFDAKEQLIMNAMDAAREGMTGRIEPRNSNE